MSHQYQVRVGRRGGITIPKALRDQHRIGQGEILDLIALSDDVYLLSRQMTPIDRIANQLAKVWLDEGETLETMLVALKAVRAEFDSSQAMPPSQGAA